MDVFFQVKPQVLEEELLWEGEPVLRLRCTRPVFSALGERAERRLNRYCQRAERLFLRHSRGRLHKRASQELLAQRSQSKPFLPWEAALEITTEAEGKLVKITLTYRRGRSEDAPHTKSTAALWQLKNGFPAKQL